MIAQDAKKGHICVHTETAKQNQKYQHLFNKQVITPVQSNCSQCVS